MCGLVHPQTDSLLMHDIYQYTLEADSPPHINFATTNKFSDFMSACMYVM